MQGILIIKRMQGPECRRNHLPVAEGISEIL
jgi:hypothetical protein